MARAQENVESVARALKNRDVVVTYAGNRPEAVIREAIKNDPKLAASFSRYTYQQHRGTNILSATSYMVQFTYDAEMPPYADIILDDGKWTLSQAWQSSAPRKLYVISSADPEALFDRLNKDGEAMRRVCFSFRDWKASRMTTKLSAYQVVLLHCEYAIETQKIGGMNQMAQQALERILNQSFAAGKGFIQRMPDHVKAYFPYSYLQQHVSFVEQPLNPRDPGYDAEADTLFGVFCRHKGSAVGLAQAYRALAERMRLDCRVIQGYAGTGDDWPPHTWCQVNVGGFYHHVDPTFGINGDSVCVDGFLKSDREMQPTHQWDTVLAPKCSLRTPSYHEVYTFIQNHYNDLLTTGAEEDLFNPDQVEW